MKIFLILNIIGDLMKRDLPGKIKKIIESSIELSTDELAQLISELQLGLDEKLEQEKKEAIIKIKEIASQVGVSVTFSEAAKKRKTGAKPGSKAKIKYRNKITGEEWSGRGIKPKWLKDLLAEGKNIDEFLTEEFKLDSGEK